MINKINLITGETYTPGELFSGTRRIIIPDLQRDYCWGNKPDGDESQSLAEGFVSTLLDRFETHPYGKLNLGLLYGYESPANYVQLCDGQQRITTLFLLMGMLNRWTGDDRYRHYLMSDFEFYDDDHEPYLQYSIRESSLYFISDLVFRFFTHGGGEFLDDVKSIFDPSTGDSCAWFYGEYVADPSIMSMLCCLEAIEGMKDKILSGGPDKIDRLMEFIADRLTFIYYDMENRTNGEETFVVINTTGEPLSATENLKPLIINADINEPAKKQYHYVNGKKLTTAMAWEEMENFFWRNRRKDKFDTADNGFNEFLRWVTLLETYQSGNQDLFRQVAKEDFDYKFPYNDISIASIVDIFNVFNMLKAEYCTEFAILANAGNGEKLDQRQLFVLLPLLGFLRKQNEPHRRQVVRFAKWLMNLIQVENVSKSVNSLLADVISIGERISDSVDILGLDGISATILTEEERIKLEVIKACPDDASRRNLEEDIWHAQDMKVDDNQSLFSGEIRTLLMWATPECELSATQFNAADFKHYISALGQLLKPGESGVNDLTRRALLAWRYKGMPWGKSYGWGGTWKHILAFDPVDFRRFIDTAVKSGLDFIINIDSTGNPIVRYPGIMGYSNLKNFDTWSASGYNVCQNSYARPIPVVLAAIMARLGAEVRRESLQHCGNWCINLTKDGVLEISPINRGTSRFDKISVTVVNGGTKLNYNVQTPSYEIRTVMPLSSVETLHQRLNPPQDNVSRRKNSRKFNRKKRKYSKRK